MFWIVPVSFLGIIRLALKCYVSWEFWFLGDCTAVGSKTSFPFWEKNFHWESIVAFLFCYQILSSKSQIRMIVSVKERTKYLCIKDQELQNFRGTNCLKRGEMRSSFLFYFCVLSTHLLVEMVNSVVEERKAVSEIEVIQTWTPKVSNLCLINSDVDSEPNEWNIEIIIWRNFF